MKRARTIVAIYGCTCAVPVSGQCANAHLPSIGGDLVPENTAFVQVGCSKPSLYSSKKYRGHDGTKIAITSSKN
jgi:hypothetical protein